MLVLNLPAFENKKYTAYVRFHRNGPYDKILTKKKPIKKLKFTLPYNKFLYYYTLIQMYGFNFSTGMHVYNLKFKLYI